MSGMVIGRGPGRAIVRDRGCGHFVGVVMRVGTAWQSWVPDDQGRLVFVGWSALRREAVEKIA